jgi:hypothetical protein
MNSESIFLNTWAKIEKCYLKIKRTDSLSLRLYVTYNASIVKIYNATSSLVRLEKFFFIHFNKRSSLPTTTLAL